MSKVYRFIKDIQLPDSVNLPAGDAVIVDDPNADNDIVKACKKAVADGFEAPVIDDLNPLNALLKAKAKEDAAKSDDSEDDE